MTSRGTSLLFLTSCLPILVEFFMNIDWNGFEMKCLSALNSLDVKIDLCRLWKLSIFFGYLAGISKPLVKGILQNIFLIYQNLLYYNSSYFWG